TKSGMFDTITVMSPLDRPGVMAAGLRDRGRGRRGGARAPEKPRPPLDDAALRAFGALPPVKEGYPNARTGVQVTYGEFAEPVIASGVAMSARDEAFFQTFAHGGFFRNETDSACVVTLDLARRLSDRDPKELVGRQLTLTWASTVPSLDGEPRTNASL